VELRHQFRAEPPLDFVTGSPLVAEVRRIPLSRRIYGIETEYGVAIEGTRGVAPTVEQAVSELYRRAPVLAAVYSAAARRLPTNNFLPNGSRFYIDVGNHPEYATPECDSVFDVVAADRAGEHIVGEAARAESERLSERAGRPITIRIIKNNRDAQQAVPVRAGAEYAVGREETFGCHENYLTLRSVPQVDLVSGLLPHFITRQLFAGSGALRSENGQPVYSISQRAPHMWEVEGSGTTRTRPIFNTRDESHADHVRFRRLHVIVGDANRSEVATYLKLGTTGLILRVIEDGTIPLGDLAPANAVAAIRAISRDVTGLQAIDMASGRTMSPLDIQEAYIERVLEMGDRWGLSPNELDIIHRWQTTIDDLRTDRSRLLKSVDWVFKLQLLEQRAARLGATLDDPRVAALDFLYHDIDRGSMFTKFVDRGSIERLVPLDVVERFEHTGPPTSRAGLRGELIGEALQRRVMFVANWDNVTVTPSPGISLSFPMPDPFASRDQRVEDWIHRGSDPTAA